MKKIFTLMIFCMIFVACEAPDSNSYSVSSPETDVSDSDTDNDTGSDVTSDPIITKDPVVEKNIVGYSVKPIDESAVFWFFSTNEKDRHVNMYTAYDRNVVSMTMTGYIEYDDGSVTTQSFVPYHFFTLNGTVYYSWMTEDEKIENGVYFPRVFLYCSQKDNAITYYEKYAGEYQFTYQPYEISDVYESDNFQIRNNQYEGKPVRDIQNVYLDSGIIRFYKIWGVAEYNDPDNTYQKSGLFFNVRLSGRENAGFGVGLYFFSKDDGGPIYVLPFKGRMWVK